MLIFKYKNGSSFSVTLEELKKMQSTPWLAADCVKLSVIGMDRLMFGDMGGSIGLLETELEGDRLGVALRWLGTYLGVEASTRSEEQDGA